MEQVRLLAAYAGIAVGVAILLSICIVWVRNRVMGAGGIVFGFFGTVLVGMTVWSTAVISVGDGGVTARFQTLEQQVSSVAAASSEVTEEVKKIADTQNAGSKQLLAVAESVKSQVPLPSAVLDQLRIESRAPAVDSERLTRAARTLATVPNAIKERRVVNRPGPLVK